MATFSTTAAEKATDLLQNLSLDPKAKNNETSDVSVADKSSTTRFGLANGETVTNPTVNPSERSITPLIQDSIDSSMYYVPGGYPTYYYGVYDSAANVWGDYSRYTNGEGADLASPGIYGDMYHNGYGYASYGPYPSPGSPAPSLGPDSSYYNAQNYHFTGSFYQPNLPKNPSNTTKKSPSSQGEVSTSKSTDQPNNGDKNGNKNGNNFQNNNSNNNNNRVGKRSPWTNENVLSDKQQKPVTVNSNSTNLNNSNKMQGRNQSLRPLPHLMASPRPTGPGIMNRMYPYNGMSLYTNTFRPNLGFGSNLYGSRLNTSWGPLFDNTKQKSRARVGPFSSFGNENFDGLSELNRGPRSGRTKTLTQTGFGPIPANQTLSTNNTPTTVEREKYNREDFADTYMDAKFFVIKSYSEDDIHKSIKYSVWASTPNGNKKLDLAYQEAKEKSGNCPIFLFFSVNTSGQFVGIAEMVGRVDFNKTMEYWQQDKWTGFFPLNWIVVKDVPNSLLKHIILENNENKPVTNSRDTQEVKLEQGLQMLKIFKEHNPKTSILDDFAFYDTREKIMQDRKAKQQQLLKKVMDGAAADAEGKGKEGVNVNPSVNPNVNPRSQEAVNVEATLKKEPITTQKLTGEQTMIVKENGTVSKDAKLTTEKLAYAKVVANGC